MIADGTENREDNALVSTEDGTETTRKGNPKPDLDIPLEGEPTAISMYQTALPFVLLIKSLNTPAHVGTASSSLRFSSLALLANSGMWPPSARCWV